MVGSARHFEFRASTGIFPLYGAGLSSRSWLSFLCEQSLSAFPGWPRLRCWFLGYRHRSYRLGAKVVPHPPKSEGILGSRPLFLQYVCAARFWVQVRLGPWHSNLTARPTRSL